MNNKGLTPLEIKLRLLRTYFLLTKNTMDNIQNDTKNLQKRYQRFLSLTGLTLIELMVTVVILSIFVLFVGMILTSSWRFWNSGWEQVGVQRDASYAFARIEKIVRSGDSAVLIGGGSGLQVTEDATIYTFQLIGDVLRLTTGGNTEDLVSGVQNNTPFSIVSDTVTVRLTLEEGNSGTDFRTTILLRNAL
jgi:prepilin-type N-terminal cleavage/methylation domain-containing protein